MQKFLENNLSNVQENQPGIFGKNSEKFLEKIQVIPELKFFGEHNHIPFVSRHLTPHFNCSEVGLNGPAMGAPYFNNYAPRFFQLLLVAYRKFWNVSTKNSQNFTKLYYIQGDPFKMSQTSDVAPCKRRF